MLSEAFMLLAGSALLMLRLGNNSGSFPRPLTVEEEQDCVMRWLEGDLEARNTLIEHNLRLVAHIIKKYYTQTMEQDDLISIGTIGLIKGVSTYRPEKGVRLATYASRCIENAILSSMRFRRDRCCPFYNISPVP
ncbi:MAG: sigma-70 family RNA polymerase sigma factor [Oscillospiraceae bacterium]